MKKSVSELLELGLELGLAAAAGVPQAHAAYQVIKTCTAEKRDPTVDEFAQMAAATEGLHKAVQQA